MRDQDDGAFVVVQRLDQRARLSISRWLVGSSRISRFGAWKAARPISRRAFSPPERSLAASPSSRSQGPSVRRGRVPCLPVHRHQPAHMLDGIDWSGMRSSSWCWAKKPIFRLGASFTSPVCRQPAGDEFREGRLAVAVRAEQRDAVVGVDAQVEVCRIGLPGSYSRRRRR
jgi:hypothetical protein